MPAKKSSSEKSSSKKVMSKTKKPNQFEHIVSASIDKLSKNYETFMNNSVSYGDSLKKLIDEYLNDLMIKINLKKEELAYLSEEYDNKKRTLEINLDLDIKKYGRDKALEILEETGEVAVCEEAYNKLKNDYNSLLIRQKEEIENAVSLEHQRNTKSNAVLKQTMELKNKAEVATVEAKLEAQLTQIEILNNTINQMKEDLNEQRKLTKDVANASNKAQMYYHPSAQMSK